MNFLSTIKKHWADCLVVAVCASVAIIKLMPATWLTAFQVGTDELLAFALIGISGLAVAQIQNDPNRITDKIDKTNERIEDLALINRAKITSIEPADHPFIWENFINKYYAINSSWMLE